MQVRNIKFYPQWESLEMTDLICSQQLEASKDPKWRDSGASSAKEYQLWSWNICGMACLKMILKKKFNKEFPTITLAKQAEQFNAYRINGKIIDGLFYKEFCEFIREKYNLVGHIRKYYPLWLLRRDFRKGLFIIASVSSSIRDPRLNLKSKGGHLVLVTGIGDKNISFHNPSGIYLETQINHTLPIKTFKNYYANRGIAIKP